MKNISKVVLCLASVALLGSCAKPISKEEAVNIASEYDVKNITETSGKLKTYGKFEGSGENAERARDILEEMGLKEGETETTIASPALLILNNETVSGLNVLYGDNISWKANGTALSYSASSLTELSIFGIKLATETKVSASYTSNGLPNKGESNIKFIFETNNSKEEYKFVVTESYTYSK